MSKKLTKLQNLPLSMPLFSALFSKHVMVFLFLMIFSSALTFSQDVDIQDAEETPTIDLEQAIQIALANNTQMKRALLSVRDADQQIRTAWSNVMPNIAASANYTRNLEVPVNFLPEIIFNPDGDPENLIPVAFGTDNNWSGGFTVSQTIFSGQAFVGISSSELYKAAQSENLRATAQGIVTQTRVTYYQALIAKEQQRLIQAQLNRLQENLDDTRQLLEQGFADEYSVLQLEVQMSNLEPQLISAESGVKSAYRELLDIMGLPVQLSINVRGALNAYDIESASADTVANEVLKKINTLTPVQTEYDSLFTEKAFDLRGDLRILEVRRQLQGKQLDAQLSQYLPTISANYNLQWNAAQAGSPVFFGDEDQRARAQTLMINVQVPLFQGFRRNAAIQQTKIQIKDTELQQYQARQTANKEILSAIENVRQAIETNDARQKAVQQAERGYERALIRYQNGVSSQQEVTDAELQLREAEINYAQMIFNFLVAKAQYDQATGQVPFVTQSVEEIKKNIELN